MELLNLEKHELIQKIHILKKRNEELEQTNQNNKTWTALLAHDFKGVFANLIWVLNLYQNKTVDINTLVELIPEVEVNAHKNIKAIDDSFSALKILLTKSPSDNVSVNLKTVFAELKKVLKAEIAKKELVFDFLGDEELSVTGNEFIIKIILRKIVDNAIKFSFRGGKITFKVEKTSDDRSQITIEDSGTGIDEYTFDRLFSLNAVALRGTEQEIGAGFGLVLVKEALNLINGTIEISSAEKGGTKVQIVL